MAEGNNRRPVKKDKVELVENEGGDPKVAGYGLDELVQAPVKSPKPDKTEAEKATSNRSVKFLIAVGVALFLIGLMLMLINLILGFVVVVLGGVAVTAAVFFPVK